MKRKLGCILKTISFCGYVMADENVYCIFHYIVMEVWFEKYLYFLFNMFTRCNVCKMYTTFKFIQPVRRSDYKQQS